MPARIIGAAALVLGLVAASPAPAQRPQAIPLPAGDGRDVVAQNCTLCHGLDTVLQLRQGAEGWRSIIDYMVLHGAQLTPDQANKAVDYLAAHFGPGENVPAPVRQVSLPDGPGKELVANNCVLCHGLDRIAAARRTPADWRNVLSRMRFLGAPVSPEDEKTIAAYLDAHFGAK